MRKKILKTLLVTTLLICFAQNSFAARATVPNTIAAEDEEFEFYQENDAIKINDPYEKINRKIYVFNDYFDAYFFKHVASFYREGVPQGARNSIRNFLTNLSLPISALNSFAQGKVDNGLATFSTFLVNSTIGVAGLFNIAGEKGIRYHQEDFGQTLGYYGVGSGSYMILPFLGPSSSRDFSGMMVDKSAGPLDFNFLEFGGRTDLVEARYRLALAAMSGVDKRESLLDILDDVQADSFDPYATIRSAYLQKRFTDIKN